MNEQISAYVLARSGRLQDGLIALLRAMPRIDAIHSMNFDLTEFQSIPDHNQTLVLLEASMLNQEQWSYIRQIKNNGFHSHCKCIVLVDTAVQQRLARSAGADEILLAGFPATQLQAAIENLFARTATVPEKMR